MSEVINNKHQMYNHLVGRALIPSNYSSVMIFDDVTIFPLWNLSGQMVGYQQYRPNALKERKNDPRDGRYYTSLHGDKNEKPLGVWGLESLAFDPNILVIVEGIFDACKIHQLGVPCVALLTSSSKHARNWLTCLGRKIYKIEDDHASKLGPYTNIKLPDGKEDVGQCSYYEVFNMLCNTIDFTSLHSTMGFWTTNLKKRSITVVKNRPIKHINLNFKVTHEGVDITDSLSSPCKFEKLGEKANLDIERKEVRRVDERQLDGVYTIDYPDKVDSEVDEEAVNELAEHSKKMYTDMAASTNVPVKYLAHPDYEVDIEKDIANQIVKDTKDGL